MRTIILFSLLWTAGFMSAQVNPTFEYYQYERKECLSPTARMHIKSMLRNNVNDLIEKDILPRDRNDRMVVAFNWPLEQSGGNNDPGYFSVVNYVDHNSTYGSESFNQYTSTNLDYDCGIKTYDTSAGYNHKGIDILTWPWGWDKMANNAVAAIAAADGIIIGKQDGYFDMNCSCQSNTWNSVYIQHSDGSESWYGHLKSGSLTSKAIGEAVTQGEYLGIVGSSGCSYDPHLHFEVYDHMDNLIDPYGGNCNSLNGNTSWWTNQPSYWDPYINKIMTHSTEPFQYFDCPDAGDVINASDAFQPCETLWWSVHVRDYHIGDDITINIKDGNGIVVHTQNVSANVTFPLDHYPIAWWKGSYDIPCNTLDENWTIEANYLSQTESQPLAIGSPLSIDEMRFHAAVKFKREIELTWVSDGDKNHADYTVMYSNNGESWESITTVSSRDIADACIYNHKVDNTHNYYQLLVKDVDGTEHRSGIQYVELDDDYWPQVYPTLISDERVIIQSKSEGNYILRDSYGRIMREGHIQEQNEIALDGYTSGLYLLCIERAGKVKIHKLIKL